jgi:secondary thiamine-phosphate synthase enzyme
LVQEFCRESGIRDGLLTLFIPHTSASLIIQENADPDVRDDLKDTFSKMVPMTTGLYRHVAEGPDDMPAHIKAALTDVSLSIPLSDGQAVFGIWQGVYVFEHRLTPHTRRVIMHLLGT